MATTTTESIDDWGTSLPDLPQMQDGNENPLIDLDIALLCGPSHDDDDGEHLISMPFSSLDSNATWDEIMEEALPQPPPSFSPVRKTKRFSTIGKRSVRDHPSPTPTKRPKSVRGVISIAPPPPPATPFEFPYDTDTSTTTPQFDIFLEDDKNGEDQVISEETSCMQVAVHDGSPVNTEVLITSTPTTPSMAAGEREHADLESESLPNHVTTDLHLRIQRASDPSLSMPNKNRFVSGTLLCRVPTNRLSLPSIDGALHAVRRAATSYVSQLTAEHVGGEISRTYPKQHVPAQVTRNVAVHQRMRQANVRGRSRKPSVARRVRRKEQLTAFNANLPPLACESMPPTPQGALTPLQCYMQSTMA